MRTFLHVTRPGVQAVPLAALREAGLEIEDGLEIELRHRDQSLPFHVRNVESSEDSEVLFLVEESWFTPSSPQIARSSVAIRLETHRNLPRVPEETPSPLDAASTEDLVPARLVRVRRFEHDAVRVPPSRSLGPQTTWWYWTMLTPLRSSAAEVDLATSAPSLGDRPFSLEILLLGWSRPALPEGLSQHRVEAILGERLVGTLEWDGREPKSFRLEGLRLTPDGSDTTLRLRVPSRSHQGEPIVDVVYLDRVEVRQPISAPAREPEGPLELAPSPSPRWLSAPEGGPDDLLFGSSGWILEKKDGGWVLPATAAPIEIWILSESSRPAHPRIEVPRNPWIRLPEDLEYLMIAPREAVPETERLADLHRHRDLETAVVELETIRQWFGADEEGPESLRNFLQETHQRIPTLRFVLLIGDADWFADARPRPETDTVLRLPTWTYLARHGSGASDHFYAASPADATLPLFAIGRVPSRTVEELSIYVDKVRPWLESPKEPRPALFLSDASGASIARRRRLVESLDGCPPDDTEATLPRSPGSAPDLIALEAIQHRQPGLVIFGGHGASQTWQLGAPEDLSPESFFNVNDIHRFPKITPAPAVAAISCGTTPFDHPSAISLGEALVLEEGGGSSAYVGSSAMLSTPERFALDLTRSLSSGESTVGEALVAAKKRLGRDEVSYLYGLLGDPALPSPTREAESCTEKQ